jgi:hypothetical protein
MSNACLPPLSGMQIGPFSPSKPNEKGKLKVKIRLNLHGIVTVESTTVSDERAPLVLCRNSYVICSRRFSWEFKLGCNVCEIRSV